MAGKNRGLSAPGRAAPRVTERGGDRRGRAGAIASAGPQLVQSGQPFAIGLQVGPGQATPEISSIRLIRNPSVTHIIDGDQRAADVEFTQNGNALVLDDLPGPYMLFANASSSDGPIPSEALQVIVTG